MSKTVTQDKFNFWLPATFEKAKDKSGNELVKISGICSSATEDSDGETLLPEGYDYTPFLKSGLLNYNHQAGKTSKAIVGEPTHAEVINDGKDLYIEGVIYPNEEGSAIVKQQEIFEKYSPNRRFGFSIEGQATERDPLNPKKITKARITGCAITACPKNPNTLMSLVKGEYSDAFVPEEEDDEDVKEKDKKKKSMDVAAMAPSTLESVDGVPKKTLTKSEVYDNLISTYGLQNFGILKETYIFVKSVNEKLYNMKGNEITVDALNKAKEMLNGISKGEGSEALTANDGEAITGTGAALAKSEVEGGVGAADPNAEAIEFAKSIYTDGMSCDSVVEGCIRKGFSLTVSQGAAESVISAANAAKEGGTTTVISTDGLMKSEDFKLFGDNLVKSVQETLSGSTLPLKDAISKGFGAVNLLLQGQEQANELLKGQLTEALDRISAIEKQPIPGKAITSNPIGRFEKGEDQGNLNNNANGNTRVISISNKLEKAQFSDELFLEFEKSNSLEIGDAITSFESANYLSESMQKRFNVKLVP